MARRARTSSPKTSTAASRRKKPATIDLQAKEVNTPSEAPKPDASVKPEVKPQAEAKNNIPPKSGADNAAKFGRGAKEQATDKPADKTVTPSEPTAKTDNSGAGFGGMFFSAVAGGIITIVGLGAAGQIEGANKLPLIGVLYGSSNSEPNAQLSQTIQELEARIKELSANANTSSVDLQPLNNRLATLEQTIGDISSNTENTGTSDNVQRLDKLEEKITSFDAALSQITDAVTNSGDAPNSAQLSASIEGLKNRTAELSTQLQSLSDIPQPDISSIESNIADLGKTVAGLQAGINVNTEALDTITRQSQELDTKVGSIKTSEKIARSVAANALGSALANGDSISIPVSSIEALTGPTEETRRLGEISSDGVISLAQISADFEKLSAIAQSETNEQSDAGIIDKFWANARSLVSIRPSGPQQGGDTIAVMSRIRAHIESDELALIDSEWNHLPEEIQSAGQLWIKRVRARVEAFALYGKIATQMSAQTE